MTTSPAPLIICPRCGAPSWNRNDADHGYCGRCHWWTSDPVLEWVEPACRNCDAELTLDDVGHAFAEGHPGICCRCHALEGGRC